MVTTLDTRQLPSPPKTTTGKRCSTGSSFTTAQPQPKRTAWSMSIVAKLGLLLVCHALFWFTTFSLSKTTKYKVVQTYDDLQQHREMTPTTETVAAADDGNGSISIEEMVQLQAREFEAELELDDLRLPVVAASSPKDGVIAMEAAAAATDAEAAAAEAAAAAAATAANMSNHQQQQPSVVLVPPIAAVPLSLDQQQHQEQQQQQHSLSFLSYQLSHDRPYNLTFAPYTQCKVTGVTTTMNDKNHEAKKANQRVPLSPSFHSILNVSTYFQTNLKILVLGDSVGIQFTQVLQEAAGANEVIMLKYAWGLHEKVSIAAPIQGGGVVAGLRHTKMFLTPGLSRRRRRSHSNWQMEDVNLLLNYSYYDDPSSSSYYYYPHHPYHKKNDTVDDNNDNNYNNPRTTTVNETNAAATRVSPFIQQQQQPQPPPHQRQTTVQQFDAMIFRIPHGWLTLEQITHDTLVESLVLSNQIFGVRTILLMTLPINNNVKTMEELEQLHRVNSMIRDVVDHWPEYIVGRQQPGEHTISESENSSRGIQHVLLLEFGKWATELTILNAQENLGWNITSTVTHATTNGTTNSSFLLDRLGCQKFPPSIAMACTNPDVQVGDCPCDRNMITIDGMHWCMEGIGGRLLGGMACLLQCPLLLRNGSSNSTTSGGDGGSSGEDGSIPNLKACEQKCNSRFMSLEPVEMLLAQHASESNVRETTNRHR
jgi:hypothetical protein